MIGNLGRGYLESEVNGEQKNVPTFVVLNWEQTVK